MSLVKYFNVDRLQCYAFETRKEMGIAAAKDAAAMLRVLLAEKETVNMMFAAAPSQSDALEALLSEPDIDWERVNAFHMDEYIGLSPQAPQGFGNFLRRAIFGQKPFKEVFYIDPSAADPQAEADRYEKVLLEHPMDICILGVGENGHVAFNDPPVADFADKRLVKTVALDEICRNQQVNDGCFTQLDEVPRTAMTVTIPGLMRAKALFCIVPAKTKAHAISELVKGEVSERCPASVLRRQPAAKLYLDADSASML
ncbi:glucosamine-6-phosphate deaminase [Anaerotruncus rubiinfantis]|jgi:glucosamine-6-phosphate deaminase|nr:glucosamine-6-phosphate deaminase [Anaerotruncus rubiinfantis]